jgi:hypothetical protein
MDIKVIKALEMEVEPLILHGTPIQITKSEQSSFSLTEKYLSDDNSPLLVE